MGYAAILRLCGGSNSAVDLAKCKTTEKLRSMILLGIVVNPTKSRAKELRRDVLPRPSLKNNFGKGINRIALAKELQSLCAMFTRANLLDHGLSRLGIGPEFIIAIA